ncbi:hypothetical protein CPB83DRAFT_898057 [Crepidotus variabilis]|uniref:Uncharacterized protein n=1 Tax=Crepidotus variabilis TaxID=179855 RepID=A0A9P6JKL0_9AGAR|nr:hypothetical protein CPB83DRAFT_898057 [Crepidotus variabilis]
MSDDPALVNASLDILAHGIFVQTCISCAAIGVEIFMWIFGFTIFLETPKERRGGRAIYVIISALILVLDCFARLPFAKYCFEMLYKPKTPTELADLADLLYHTWYLRTSDWASAVIVWVSSGLLVYRCYIVWIDRPLVVVIPALMYLAAIGISIAVYAQIFNDNFVNRIDPVSIGLTVALNALVMLLICWRLIYFRKRQAAVLGSFDSKMYIGAMSILVESALPLALVGIAHIIASAYGGRIELLHWQQAHYVFLTLWECFIALAPQLIIFRVTIGRSWAERSMVSSHLTMLAFQQGTFNSSANDDLEASISDQDNIIPLHLKNQPSDSEMSEKFEAKDGPTSSDETSRA